MAKVVIENTIASSRLLTFLLRSLCDTYFLLYKVSLWHVTPPRGHKTFDGYCRCFISHALLKLQVQGPVYQEIHVTMCIVKSSKSRTILLQCLHQPLEPLLMRQKGLGKVPRSQLADV